MPFNHFDHVAGIYSKATEFPLAEEVTTLLDLSPDSTLLDLGGGTGRVTAALRVSVKRAVVVDLSMGMLRFARQKRLIALCAPAEDLPFPSSSFNCIVMVDTLHHIQGQSRAIQELWRVLKVGGKVLIIEPDIDRFIVKLIVLMEKALLMHSHFLSAGKIQDLFSGKGARSTSLRTDTHVLTLAEKAREM